MRERPFQHIVRVRATGDFQYVNPDVMDEVTINANQLENDIESAAVTLWRTTLPFTVDPVLWRFQVPEWWRNAKGATKRNYARLGAWYAKGTRVPVGSVPLVDAVEDARDWRTLSANAVSYQCSRLLNVPTHLTLFEDNVPVRDLHPARVIAPALVAFTTAEDKINAVLFDAAASALGTPVAARSSSRRGAFLAPSLWRICSHPFRERALAPTCSGRRKSPRSFSSTSQRSSPES